MKLSRKTAFYLIIASLSIAVANALLIDPNITGAPW